MKHGIVKLCTQVFNEEKRQIEPGEVIAEAPCEVSFSQKDRWYRVIFSSGVKLKAGEEYCLVFPWLWSRSKDGLESVCFEAKGSMLMTQLSFKKSKGMIKLNSNPILYRK